MTRARGVTSGECGSHGVTSDMMMITPEVLRLRVSVSSSVLYVELGARAEGIPTTSQQQGM